MFSIVNICNIMQSTRMRVVNEGYLAAKCSSNLHFKNLHLF